VPERTLGAALRGGGTVGLAMKDIAVSADGLTVHYEVHGIGTPALVFVHGWSCDRTYWSGQVDYFAVRHQMVTIDLAGHGESGTGRESWTMPAFGDDVVAVIERLRLGSTVLVGHSMGGDVIVEAALRLPGRVAGLVWADTYSTLGEAITDEEVRAFAAPFREDFVTATRALVRRMFIASSAPELVERVVTDMSSAAPDIAVDALEHAIGNERAVLAALPQLIVPVVAINPDYRPTDVEALRRHGVRAVLMPGVAHFLMMEDPETFNRLLDEAIEGFGGSAPG
jgi:pimeloyl-ACP methyl ester carboxylesterase